MAGVDWSRITFTEHMTEAAAVVGQCEVVIDFDAAERTAYEIRVYQSLKGHGDEPYFAVATNRGDAEAFRPIGTGETAEAALQECLANAGIYHRRRVKQSNE
jgi:hypothetical protein